jgi:hypothetical protein
MNDRKKFGISYLRNDPLYKSLAQQLSNGQPKRSECLKKQEATSELKGWFLIIFIVGIGLVLGVNNYVEYRKGNEFMVDMHFFALLVALATIYWKQCCDRLSEIKKQSEIPYDILYPQEKK